MCACASNLPLCWRTLHGTWHHDLHHSPWCETTLILQRKCQACTCRHSQWSPQCWSQIHFQVFWYQVGRSHSWAWTSGDVAPVQSNMVHSGRVATPVLTSAHRQGGASRQGLWHLESPQHIPEFQYFQQAPFFLLRGSVPFLLLSQNFGV